MLRELQYQQRAERANGMVRFRLLQEEKYQQADGCSSYTKVSGKKSIRPTAVLIE